MNGFFRNRLSNVLGLFESRRFQFGARLRFFSMKIIPLSMFRNVQVRKSETIAETQYFLGKKKERKKRKRNDSAITRSALLLRRNIFNGTLPIKYKRFAGIREENGSLQKKKRRGEENLSRVSPLQVDRAGVDRRGTKSEGPTSGL